jgi:hypothetical protein
MKRNSAVERLGMFVGEWHIEITSMSFEADKTAVVRGHASFEWTEDGTFLMQHSEVSNSDFPRITSIIGPDDAAGTYCMLYSDSRGVSRIYQMSLSGNEWKLWRDFPEFSQRFIATWSEDGNTIAGRWEQSSDGSSWKLDFNETYSKVKSTHT